VPAAILMLADICRFLPVLSKQCVNERGLAHAGRAKQRDCLPSAAMLQQRIDPASRECTDRINGDAERDGLHLSDQRHKVLAYIRLVKDDDGSRAAVPDKRKVTLNETRIEIAV